MIRSLRAIPHFTIWGPASIVMGLAVIAGMLSVQRRSFLSLVAIPPFAIISLYLNQTVRFWLFAAAAALAPLQLATLPFPYRLSPNELLLIGLAAMQLLAVERSKHTGGRPGAGLSRYAPCLPFLGFALVSLIPALANNEFPIWHVVAMVPLLMMVLAISLAQTPARAEILIWMAVVAVFGYLLIQLVADLTGSAQYFLSGYQGRLGSAIINLGPIQYISHSVIVGTLASLPIPALAFLGLRASGLRVQGYIPWLVMGILVVVMMLSAARGAFVGALAGVAVTLILSGRFRSPSLIAAGVILTIAWSFWGGGLGSSTFEDSLARFSEMQYGIASIGNMQSRLDTLQFTVGNVLENPVGYGFNYLWVKYALDESILYSALLNGTGLGGFAAFTLLIGYLLTRFVTSARRADTVSQRGFAVVGAGTIATLLVGAVASESAMLESVHSVVLWTIISAAHAGVYARPSKGPDPGSGS